MARSIDYDIAGIMFGAILGAVIGTQFNPQSVGFFALFGGIIGWIFFKPIVRVIQ
jgi:hypothetical protein